MVFLWAKKTTFGQGKKTTSACAKKWCGASFLHSRPPTTSTLRSPSLVPMHHHTTPPVSPKGTGHRSSMRMHSYPGGTEGASALQSRCPVPFGETVEVYASLVTSLSSSHRFTEGDWATFYFFFGPQRTPTI